MVSIYDTVPIRIMMPDDRAIDNYYYTIRLRLNFEKDEPGMWGSYIGDLTEYYEFVNDNGIFMEHDILITGHEDGLISTNVLVCFYFLDDIDAMAFKLRWK